MKISASEIIELQRQRIQQLECENEAHYEKLYYYFKELCAEIGVQKPLHCDYNTMRIMLGQIRNIHNKPFDLENDRYEGVK